MSGFYEPDDEFKSALAVLEIVTRLAAGEPDLKANELEEYWKRGAGAARIRWGTSGDFTRCEAALDSKVGGARAKRICAQWHHDMTGLWPGDRRNV